MNTVYVAPPADDLVWRTALYAGQLFVCSPRTSDTGVLVFQGAPAPADRVKEGCR